MDGMACGRGMKGIDVEGKNCTSGLRRILQLCWEGVAVLIPKSLAGS